MTREELREHCEKQIKNCEMWATYNGEEPHGKIYEEHKLILELLEQEPKTGRWLETSDNCNRGSMYRCSECGCLSWTKLDNCPNCKADIR